MTEKSQPEAFEKMRAEDPSLHDVDEEHPVLLVVDDDQDILRVVRFYLTKQNYTVHTANSGKEALSLLESHSDIELILSDVMMPEMSGLELLKTLREDEKHNDIPVILISAEGETSKKVIGLNLGADDFISKPFNFDELMARVKNHIRLRRLQKEVLFAHNQVMHVNEMLQSHNEKLIQDLEAARSIQIALMPDFLPEHPKFLLGSYYLPAERLGGDFFDIVTLAEGRKLGVLVADVCGHGVTAAFTTAMTKITFRNSCFSSEDPAEVLMRMNDELFGNLKNEYVTVFYGILDVESGKFVFASGGHPPLLVHRRKDNRIEELRPQATFLGIFNSVEITSESVTLEKGDRIFFYTDGLFESRNGADEEFGLERVKEIISRRKDDPLQTQVNGMIESLVEFIDGVEFDDDITVVGIDIRK